MRMQLLDGGYAEVYADDDGTVRLVVSSAVNMTFEEAQEFHVRLGQAIGELARQRRANEDKP